MHFPFRVPAPGRNLQQSIHIPKVHLFFLCCLHPAETHTLVIPGAFGSFPADCASTFCTNSTISAASAISLSCLACSSLFCCSCSRCSFVSCCCCFLSVCIRSRSRATSFFSCSSASRCSCSILSRCLSSLTSLRSCVGGEGDSRLVRLQWFCPRFFSVGVCITRDP